MYFNRADMVGDWVKKYQYRRMAGFVFKMVEDQCNLQMMIAYYYLSITFLSGQFFPFKHFGFIVNNKNP